MIVQRLFLLYLIDDRYNKFKGTIEPDADHTCSVEKKETTALSVGRH